MLKKVVLVLGSLLGSGVTASGQLSLSEIEEMLGSDDFEIRRKGSVSLWEEGGISLDHLERLSQSSDPEIKARSLSLYRKLLLELSPDTPQEILDLVDDYFTSPDKGKVALFNTLKSKRNYPLMLRLRQLEKSEGVLARMNEIIADVLPRLQLSLLRKGDFDQAKELLLINHDFRSLIAYASLCDYLGELDHEIGKLRYRDDKKSRARYLACLRVKGDPAVLKAEAIRLGDHHAMMVASLVMGEVDPIFEYLDKEGDLPLVDGYYLDWLLAERAGDTRRLERRFDSIRHLLEGSSESFEARNSLLKMGLLDEVLKGYDETFTDESRYYFLLMQDRYIEALKLIGLEEAVVTDEWTEAVYERTVERLKVEGDVEPFYEFFTAASFFENRGMIEEASQCIERFFDAVREAEDSRIYEYYQRAYSYSPQASLIAFDREVEGFDVEVGELIATLFGDLEKVEWLKMKLLSKEDNRSAQEILRLMTSFSNEPIVPADLFEEVEKKFREEAIADTEPEKGLQYLLDFASDRREGEDILLYCRLLKETEFGLNPLYEADHLAYQEKYEEASKIYADYPFVQSSSAKPSTLYRSGLVMKKTGDFLGESLTERGILLSQGEIEDQTRFAGHHFRIGDYKKSREYYRSALMRMERVDLADDDLLGSVIEGNLSGAVQERNWKFALALSELKLWMLKGERDVYLVRGRFQVLFCRGMLAAEEGRVEQAQRELRAAHHLIPRDGMLADDFFPALRGAGLVELHDELFEISAELSRENVRFFPKDDNAKNTFGWLASRANRCLDEAEEYLKQSLEARPMSEAYLDTMAEIHFAKGDRSKAIEWSDRAVSRDVYDSQLRQQNRRFRNDPFPSN